MQHQILKQVPDDRQEGLQMIGSLIAHVPFARLRATTAGSDLHLAALPWHFNYALSLGLPFYFSLFHFYFLLFPPPPFPVPIFETAPGLLRDRFGWRVVFLNLSRSSR